MMERFTGRNESGDLTLCGEQVYGNNQNVYNALSELEQYELTGLEPDEIPQLQEKYDTAIKALSGAILGKAEIPHWIPVSERLPDKEVLVLLFLRSPKGETKITTGEIYASNNKKFDGEFCIGFDPLSPDFLNREVVTHWMPLPQPPKGEKL